MKQRLKNELFGILHTSRRHFTEIAQVKCGSKYQKLEFTWHGSSFCDDDFFFNKNFESKQKLRTLLAAIAATDIDFIDVLECRISII